MTETSRFYKLRDLFEFFLAYSVFGWLYESVWYSMVESQIGFVNRGFLFGPWLPIYGFGMLLITFVLNKFNIKNGYAVFFTGTIISTLAELIGSYLSELISGKTLWDYSDYFLNFQGRIALKPDMIFGLLTLFVFFQICPVITNLQKRYKYNIKHNIITGSLAVLFCIDLIARIWLGSNFME